MTVVMKSFVALARSTIAGWRTQRILLPNLTRSLDIFNWLTRRVRLRSGSIRQDLASEYELRTVSESAAICRSRGIPGSSGLRKKNLVDILRAHDAAVVAAGAEEADAVEPLENNDVQEDDEIPGDDDDASVYSEADVLDDTASQRGH